MQHEITIDDLTRLESPSIIDVREQSEYDEAHIDGVPLIPMSDFLSRLDQVPDGTVYVLCRSGARSGRVAEYLRQNGHDAINIAGGIQAWISAGNPVVTASSPG